MRGDPRTKQKLNMSGEEMKVTGNMARNANTLNNMIITTIALILGTGTKVHTKWNKAKTYHACEDERKQNNCIKNVKHVICGRGRV